MTLLKKASALLALSFFAFAMIAAPALAANANANANANKKKTDVTVTTTSNTGSSKKSSVSLQINENVKRGSKSDTVKLLQSVLAAGSGLSSTDVTGFFGPKTLDALKKFQAKKGLVADGIMGPKTRAAINAELGSATLEESTDAQGRSCVKIPPGHLIAPGWLRKQSVASGAVSADIPLCQVLPPGIAKKLNGGWSGGGPTNDITGPTISSIAISGISTTAATLKFNTNEGAVYEVMYGTTASYGTTSIKTTTFATSHTFAFTGLAEGTTYHYQIKAYDQAGNSTLSADKTFTTSTTDTTAPVISAISATAITHNSATIYWTTNEASTSVVNYGPTSSYVASSESSTPVVIHSRTLTGLSAATTYHYQVKSVDGEGNAATSGDLTFTTLAAPDITAPVISSVASGSVTTSGATVTWSTNEAATGKVMWGITSGFDKAGAPSLTTVLGTNHSAAIGGLTANTQYYYVVEAKDASNNTSTSTEATFTTLP